MDKEITATTKQQNNYIKYYVSEHYDFYCKTDSYAAKNIKQIANYQEKCYDKITKKLNIFPEFKIEYLFADTPQEIGKLYGDDEPCNGFVKLPNKIYAVYSKKLKCIGMHEDAHVISYSVKKPQSVFIGEGLAMYFDASWQGKDNIAICKEIINKGIVTDILQLIDNDRFFSLNENITYPVAGAFTSFLIEKLSLKTYLEKIFFSDDVYTSLDKLFDKTKLNKEFIGWLSKK